ncbi:MAG TPA: protein TolR [Burkholderiales bacterium]|nr:protein TolR [Burkholderiales bacterium]
MPRQRRAMSEINVVPYIDVMLVLLVIFMITAPLVNPGVVDLPTLGKSAHPPEFPLEVVIKADASLLLRERSKTGSSEHAVSTAELVSALQEKQKTHPDQAVVIAADKSVRYEEVLKVMDELQKQHVLKVGLLVKPAAR